MLIAKNAIPIARLVSNFKINAYPVMRECQLTFLMSVSALKGNLQILLKHAKVRKL
jgi:hypothetical protein